MGQVDGRVGVGAHREAPQHSIGIDEVGAGRDMTCRAVCTDDDIRAQLDARCEHETLESRVAAERGASTAHEGFGTRCHRRVVQRPVKIGAGEPQRGRDRYGRRSTAR